MMILRFSTPPSVACERAGRVSAMTMLRLALAVVISFVLIIAALAAAPTLKGDVVVGTDALTLGDLVDGLPPETAGWPLFRAPAFGQSGTIQARRILEAARPLGLSTIETGGRTQVTVTRAARRIATAEIEAALKRALETQHGIEARALSISFDGPAPSLMVAPETQGQVTVEELAYDRRNRRVSALVWVGPQPTERKAFIRIAGVAMEYVEVAVLTRALGRGETAQAADFMVEKRAKDTLPADVQSDTQTLTGRVARRALQVGSVVRTGDLARPEIVARGDVVTIVYEVPGMTLTLRGRASDGGAQGDTIAVVNPQSKKALQAQVVAPGKVSVSGPLPGRVATNAAVSPAQP
jgi:flagellar basal body P-ring formation protein FlgA